MKKIAIFGASGFGREVADICVEIGYNKIVFLEQDVSENFIGCYKILEDTPENVQSLEQDNFKFSIGIGNPRIRRIIAEKYPNLEYPNIIHPSATFGLNQLEEINSSKGTIIAAGCRMTNNISVGNFIILNLNVTVGHDTILEDFISAMPGSNISGNVQLMPCTYIGTGAVVIHGGNEKKLLVGENAIIGSGAVVTRDVDNNTTVVGMPAKPLNR